MIRLATLLGLLVVVALASAATARVGPPDATAEGGFDDVYVKPDEQGIWGSVLQAVGLAQFEKSYAVVIGISDFEGYNDLSTQQDTIRMRDFLINDANFDYVHTLTGANATKARINELMSDVFPELVGENDRFVFYWSGHGVTRPTRSGTAGYLPLADSPKGKYSTMVAMDDLERWDGFILANHVLYLLDSCFSGLAGVEAKSDVRDLNIAQMVGPSRHVLSAGTGDEEAIVIPELGGSLFTTAVIDGLRGEADASTGRFESDQLVSITELKNYVSTRVEFEKRKKKWDKSITPQLTSLGVNKGSFFFAVPEGDLGALGPIGTEIKNSGAAVGKGDGGALPETVVAAIDAYKGKTGQTTAVAAEPVNASAPSFSQRDIQIIQQNLTSLGYDPGPADGEETFQLQIALATFQRSEGLSVTGRVNEETRIALLMKLAEPPTPPKPSESETASALPLAPLESTQTQTQKSDAQRPCETCPAFVTVPAGFVTLGRDGGPPEEGPPLTFEIAAFAMSTTEVTSAAFSEFLNANLDRFKDGNQCYQWTSDAKLKRTRDPLSHLKGLRPEEPVSCVSALDAQAYVDWLNLAHAGENSVYMLPSEAQFERALRSVDIPDPTCQTVNGADDMSQFPWKDTSCSDGFRGPAPAGRFPPNDYGLHDMIGNLWEWSGDCWIDSHWDDAAGSIFDPPAGCEGSLRGASFDDPRDNLRPTIRQKAPLDRRQVNVGFRVVRTDFETEQDAGTETEQLASVTSPAPRANAAAASPEPALVFGNTVYTSPAEYGVLNNVALFPDGTGGVLASQDGNLYVVDAASEALRHKISVGSEPFDVALSDDGSTIYAGGAAGTLHVFDAGTGNQKYKSVEGAEINAIGILPIWGDVITGDESGNLEFWTSGEPESYHAASPFAANEVISSVDAAPNAERVVVGGSNGSVAVYEIDSSSVVARPEGAAGEVYQVRYSPDGARIAASSADGNAYLWDNTSGTLLHRLSVGAEVFGLDFAAGGEVLIAGAKDGRVLAWSVESGTLIDEMRSDVGEPWRLSTLTVEGTAIGSVVAIVGDQLQIVSVKD